MAPSASTLAPTRSPGAITLFAAAFAWFAELNVGYVLATQPCFPADRRLVLPAPSWAWTHPALFGVAGLCVLVALLALLQSLRALRAERTDFHALTAAGGRSRFATLWAVAFGGFFFVATVLTGVGLFLLPRCGG